MSLKQLLLKASKNKVAEGTVEMENDNEDGNHEFYDAAEGDDDYDQKSLSLIGRRWWRRVYEVVSATAGEFNGNF